MLYGTYLALLVMHLLAVASMKLRVIVMSQAIPPTGKTKSTQTLPSAVPGGSPSVTVTSLLDKLIVTSA